MITARMRKNETVWDFMNRICKEQFIAEEESMLAYFRRHRGRKPDGSFLLGAFWNGWERAQRKYSPKQARP